MIIKKFKASTIKEALEKVREELGTDAIIINTRSDKQGGIFDFVGQRMVEVTAALDDKPVSNNGARVRSQRRNAAPIGPAEAKAHPPQRSVAYEPAIRRDYTGKPGNVDVKYIENRVHVEQLLDDINDLKRSMKVLADTALTGEMAGLPPNLASLLSAMQSSGVDDKITKRLIRQLLNDLTGSELTDPSAVRKKATDLLLSSMKEVSPIAFAGPKPRIVTFVGPTGSGKTTTIAKLASEFILNMNKTITVLTIDTKRVDAVGQLKTYCQILNIPLFIAYTPDDLSAFMQSIEKSDMTLVDTPGSGPMDKSQMIEMMEFLQKMVPQEVHLVMSVTISYHEMNRILDNFNILKPNRILFTKLDETDSYGPMLSCAIMAKTPMSYVTFGQNVPGNFSVADPKNLIEGKLTGGTE